MVEMKDVNGNMQMVS